MKLIGTLLLVCACWSMGISKAAALKKRVRSLETMLLFLKCLSDEMRYTMEPITELLCRLSERETFRTLHFLSAFRQPENDMPFSRRWKEAVTQNGGALHRSDLQIIASLGEVIGTSDLAGQTAYLEHFQVLLRAQLQDATEHCAKYAQMYRTLGLLLGIGTAILAA